MLMSDKNQNNPKQPTYYVYALIDPRNNQPFYIGKGKDDRVVRHYYNWSSIDKSNPYKARKIKKLKELGYTPTYKIIFESSEEQLAFEKEKQLIAKWGRFGYEQNGILTNVNPGGEGNTGGQRPVKQYNLFGEYIQTFSSCLGAIKSLGGNNSSSIVECCQKKGRSAYGYFWSYANNKLDLEWCFGGKKKPVYQWDLEGNFVNRFINAYQAGYQFNQKSNPGAAIRKFAEKSSRFKGYYWTLTNTPPSNS